jgi:ABC-type lipoprotein release transport system permease subunit
MAAVLAGLLVLGESPPNLMDAPTWIAQVVGMIVVCMAACAAPARRALAIQPAEALADEG